MHLQQPLAQRCTSQRASHRDRLLGRQLIDQLGVDFLRLANIRHFTHHNVQRDEIASLCNGFGDVMTYISYIPPPLTLSER